MKFAARNAATTPIAMITNSVGSTGRYWGIFFHLILNAYWEALEFELPPLEVGPWRRWIDTALDSPEDIVPWESAPAVSTDAYTAEARSVVMLFAEIDRK